MKRLLLLILLALPFLGFTQQVGDPVTISNPGSMYTTYSFKTDDIDLIVNAVGRSEYNAIAVSSNEDAFPSGMANLDDFFENIEYIKKYKAYYVCKLADGKLLLRIPASENSFQPANMRPSKNIYFIMGADGVALKGGSYSSSTTSAFTSNIGIEFDEEVSVTNFGDMYSTYNMSPEDETILLKAVGRTQKDNLLKYAREDSWPSSISDFTVRQGNRDKMYDYKLNFVAEITGEKSVVIAKKSRNGNITGGMALSHDIYFVIKSGSIASANAVVQSVIEEPVAVETPYNSVVKDFGDLMSTYTLTPENSKEIVGKVGRSELANITKYCNEGAWPSDISEFNKRQTNRPKMYNYNLTEVCTFGGDSSIIKAAVANNKHMTGGMALTHDIYFIIYTKAIRK